MCTRVAKTGVAAGALSSLLLLGLPQTGHAQVQRACYIPEVGAVYRIGEVGLPTECVAPTHVEFSWPAVDHDHQVTNLQGRPVSGDPPPNGAVLVWDSQAPQWRPLNLSFYTRRVDSGNVCANCITWRVATCDTGDQLVSGGYNAPWMFSVYRSGPEEGSDGWSWRVDVYNPTSETTRVFSVYAVCLHLN